MLTDWASMLYGLSRGKNRAFTLLELIVTIVILGLLATISVPTFQNIIDKTKLQTDIISMETLARAQAARAALDLGTYDFETVKETIASTSAGGKNWVYQPTSTKFGEVSASLSEDLLSLQIAAISTTGKNCIIVNIVNSSTAVRVADANDAGCAADYAPVDPDDPNSILAPSNVRGVLKESDYSIDVTWNGSSSSYNLERKTVGGEWASVEKGLKTKAFNDKTVMRGESYIYRVISVTANAVSKPSLESATVTVIPNAPTNVQASVNSQEVILTWDEVYGATTYQVYREINGLPINVTSTNTATFTIPYGSEENLFVRAGNAGGLSEASESVNVKILPAPVELTATNQIRNVKLEWTESSRNATYVVKRSSAEDMSNSSTLYQGSALTFVDSSASYEIPYFYQIEVVSNTGSNISNVVTGIANAPIPESPNPFTGVVADDGVVTLNWGASEYPNGYDLYKNDIFFHKANPNDLTNNLSRMLPGETASFGIEAYNAAGRSERNTTSITAKPATPTNFQAVFRQANKTVDLTWNAMSGATSYNVTINGVTQNVTVPRLTVNAPDGTINTYSVTALNAGGESAAVTRNVTPPPLAPTNFKVAMNNKTATLTWTPSATATSYLVLNSLGALEQVIVGQASKTYVTTIDEGLTADFTLYAVNANGRSVAVYASGTSIPAKVSNFQAAPSGNSAVLTWEASAKADSYDILANGVIIQSSVTGLTHTYTPVPSTPGATVNFEIYAKNAAGQSARSNTTFVFAPATPTISLTAGSDDIVTASWNAINGATSYEVQYRRTTDAANVWTSITTQAAVRTTTLPLAYGVGYQARIRAINSGGESSWSVVRGITIRPPAPTLQSATVTQDGSDVTLTWTRPAGAAGYVIYADGLAVQTIATATTLTTTYSLNSGTSAVFTVRATNNGGQSNSSNAITATAAPSAPVLSGSLTGNVAALTWPNVTGATNYDLYQNGVISRVNTVSGINMNINPGLTSSFTVVAKNSSGTSPVSNTVTLTAAPNAPVLNSSASLNGLNFTWSAVSGATSYEVQYRYKGQAAWTDAPTRTNTSFLPTQVAGQTYQARVTAVNAGGVSPWSNIKEQAFRPDAPTNVSATVTNTTATITWTAPFGATDYELYADGVKVKDISGNVTTTTYPVAAGSQVSFALTALNEGQRSVLSDPYIATGAPTVPQNFTAVLTGTSTRSARLNWNAVEGATSYRVYIDGVSYQTGITDLTLTVPMPAGSVKAFSVSAVSDVGESGQTASIQLAVAPRPLTNIRTTSQVLGQTVISWDSSPGAAHYTFTVTGATITSGVTNGIVSEDNREVVISGTPGTAYTYTAYAVGETGLRSTVTNISGNLRPASVTNLKAVMNRAESSPGPDNFFTPGSATITWTKPIGVFSGYEVLVNGNVVPALISPSASATSFTYNFLNGGEAYKIEFFTLSGNNRSQVAAVEFVFTPRIPQNFRLTSNATQVLATWDASRGADYYNLKVGSLAAKNNLTRTSETFTPAQLPAGTSVTSTISAVNDFGANTITNTSIAPPLTPRTVTAVSSGLVSWAAPSSPTTNVTYEVYTDSMTAPVTRTATQRTYAFPANATKLYLVAKSAGGTSGVIVINKSGTTYTVDTTSNPEYPF